MKKILFLSDVNSSHTRKWVSGVASMGFRTALFSLSAPEYDWYTEYGVQLLGGKTKVSRKTFFQHDIAKIKYLGFYRSLKKAVHSFSPDLVHAHYATSYGMLGALVNRHPLLVSVWGSDVFDFPKRSFFHRSLQTWIFRKSDLLLSTSHIMKQEILKYANVPVEVTPFGIDTDKFFSFHRAPDDTLTIGIIKSLESHYGIDYLIRAFDQVIRKYPGKKIRLLIVGEGTRGKEYRDLVVRLNLGDRVIFTGKINPDEIPAMHNRIDLFVNPSLHESFGVSVLEASACEVPVIATRAGGLKEVVLDHETGLTVHPGSTEEIADAICYFIDHPEQLSRYGKRGREFVQKNYEWKHCLLQIADIYNRF